MHKSPLENIRALNEAQRHNTITAWKLIALNPHTSIATVQVTAGPTLVVSKHTTELTLAAAVDELDAWTQHRSAS